MSALAQPEATFGEDFLHQEIYEAAAAYLFHLVRNHPFHDGNKRIAALVASAFLEVNGLKVIAPEEEFEKLVMDAAQSVVTKEQISEFFKRHTERV